MARAEFAKAYELAYGWELYAKNSGPLQVYSPSQVQEAMLGFDLGPARTQPPDLGVLAAPRPAGGSPAHGTEAVGHHTRDSTGPAWRARP